MEGGEELTTYELSIMITEATLVTGRGNTQKAAMTELLADALCNLNDDDLMRFQSALAPEVIE